MSALLLNREKGLDHGGSVGDSGDVQGVDNDVVARLQDHVDLSGGIHETGNVDLLNKQVQTKITDTTSTLART